MQHKVEFGSVLNSDGKILEMTKVYFNYKKNNLAYAVFSFKTSLDFWNRLLKSVFFIHATHGMERWPGSEGLLKTDPNITTLEGEFLESFKTCCLLSVHSVCALISLVIWDHLCFILNTVSSIIVIYQTKHISHVLFFSPNL